MTEAEAQELREMGAEITGALQCPWQPRTIARAFATRKEGEVVFTMQRWIDLDAVRSPLLIGQAPKTETELRDAFEVFGLDLDGATAEDIARIVRVLQREIDDSFAAHLPMDPPEAGEPGSNDGFGDWAPIFAALVTQCRLSLAEALAIPVAAASVLLAAHRSNQRWRPTGTPYALRDIEEAHG